MFEKVSKIKIIFVISGLSIGGAELMLYKLLYNLDRSRFEPIVISLMNSDAVGMKIKELAIPVKALHLNHTRSIFSSILWFRNFLAEQHVDVIHGWMYHGNLFASLVLMLCSLKPIVIWGVRHSIHDIKFETTSLRLIIKVSSLFSARIDAILYNSQVAAIQHKNIGFRYDKALYIANGFDLDLFCPNKKKCFSIKHSLSLSDDLILIGMFCRYHKMKSIDTFLSAAKLLINRLDNVRFVLAGNQIEDSNSELKHKITQLQVGDMFFLLGERNDLTALYASLDIYTSCSSWGEGFSNSIGEAMSSSVPCVVTNVGDSALIIGDAGLVIPPSQPEALAKAWFELIDRGEEHRRMMGMRGRQRIIENYSIDVIVKQYEHLYESLLDNKSPGSTGN